MGVHTDVIIVGAGHNGLIAAPVLAKRGVRVTVVEERGMIGGATKTELTLHRLSEADSDYDKPVPRSNS